MSVFGFFPYGAMNYKAAQAYLDRQAAKGLVLDKIWLGCVARFQPDLGRSHFVDLDCRAPGGDPDQDFLQLCADAGWEHIRTLRGMLLFRSAPGASPVPIQTDPQLEWENFWKKYVKKQLVGLVIALLLLAGLLVLCRFLPGRGPTLSSLVTANAPLLYLLALSLGLIVILFSGVHDLRYLLRCRRASRVVVPGRRSTALLEGLSRLYVPLYLLAWCLSLGEGFGLGRTVDLSYSGFSDEYTATVEACRSYPVVIAPDLGLPSGDSRYLDGRRSILADSLSYSEITQDGQRGIHILSVERFQCAGEPLARQLLDWRRQETAAGAFTWGVLDWIPAPDLGFDEGYATQDGSYVLLRQGNVVALVGCSGLDLTSSDMLDIMQERLALEMD